MLDQPQKALTLLVGDASQTLEDLPFGISDHPLEDEMFRELQKTGTVWFQGGKGMLMSTSLWLQK